MQKILEQVLKKITPSKKEIGEQQKLSRKLISKIMSTKGKHVHAEIVGSNARNTHLAGDNDLDIFVFYPPELSREEFEKEGLAIGKMIFNGHEWEKAYSEHPYIRGRIEGFDVEVVPAYKVENAENLKSAVDRTLFHNSYLQKNMKQGQENEVRLLKQFMKGVKCYGADLSSNSFPGYVAELLVLKYGDFEETIEAAANWKKGEVIDLENHHTGEEAKKKFNSHLIVVDPVDRNRNVAAALSLNQYSRFIAACRAFLKKTSTNFFFPKPHKAWASKQLKDFLGNTELVAVMLAYPKGFVEDVMWGQLRRFSKKLATIAQQNGFIVKRTGEWVEHKKHLVVLLEVESIEIQKAKVVVGPEVFDENNSTGFLQAHPKPLAGPRIENARWVIEVQRKHTDLEKLLKEELVKLRSTEREGMKKALRQKARIMEEKDILSLYSKNRGFQQFLTAYLKAKEEFLEK